MSKIKMGLSKVKHLDFFSTSSDEESEDDIALTKIQFSGNPVVEHLKDPLPPICKAIRSGSLTDLITLSKKDNDLVNTERFHNQPPLHFACHMKRLDFVATLLQLGAKVDSVDGNEHTALYISTVQAWPEGIKILLENGAPATQLSLQTGSMDKLFSNNTLLHSLLQSQRKRFPEPLVVECAELLIENGLDVNATNLEGESLLYCAALANYPTLVEKLLELKANPTHLTLNNRNVLHASCISGSFRCLEILLRNQKIKDYFSQEDKSANSPFHLAVKNNSYKCCFVLLNNGDHLLNEDSKGRPRCELVSKMPSATKLYKKLFDHSVQVSGNDIHDPDLKITFNYRNIVQQKCKTQCSPVYELLQCADKSIFEQPILENFLTYKWNCIKPLFYVKLLIYSIFLIVHTWYIVTTYGRFPRKWIETQAAFIVFQIIYLVLFISFLVPDTLFMLINIKRYFREWETLVKLLTLGTAAFIIFSPSVLSNKHIPQIVQKDSQNNEVYYPLEFDPLRSNSGKDSIILETDDNDKIIFPGELSEIVDENGRIPIVFPGESIVFPNSPIKFPVPAAGKIDKSSRDKSINPVPAIQSMSHKNVKIASRFGVANIPEEQFSDNNTDILNSTFSTLVPLETYAAAVSAFLSWAEFMMLLAKVPDLGIQILIFNHIALSLAKFLFAFSSLIIGFSVSFHVIFKNLDAFGTVEGSFIKTLVMMIGEIEYGSLLETPTPLLSKCFLVVFLFLITVLMANLLIGLTIDDIPKLKHEGVYMRLQKQASYLASYENLLTITKKLKCFPFYCVLSLFRSGKFDIKKTVTVYPNRDNKFKVPIEIINKVKLNFDKEQECSQSIDTVSSDIHSEFRYFKEQYHLDKQVLHKRLDEIMAALMNR